MIIPAVTYLAVRCPGCGRLQVKPLSLFACYRGGEVAVSCSCRAPLFSYSSDEDRCFRVWLQCILCEGLHPLRISLRELTELTVVSLVCETTGAEVALVGPRERLRRAGKAQERRLRELIRDLGQEEYFANPEVMYRVLQYLHQLALSGNLYCHCGNNDIEVEVFPDRVELHCPECQASGSVMAETRKDLAALRRIREIELVGRGFRCRQATRNPGSPGRSTSD
ncbi:MAG: hypothetical protein ACPLPT_04525 [Moorellales bacterium]